MKQVTRKTVRAVSGSSIALSIISILITLGLIYAAYMVFGPQVPGALVALFAFVVLGISIYYFAFSVLSWAYLRKKSPSAAEK